MKSIPLQDRQGEFKDNHFNKSNISSGEINSFYIQQGKHNNKHDSLKSQQGTTFTSSDSLNIQQGNTTKIAISANAEVLLHLLHYRHKVPEVAAPPVAKKHLRSPQASGQAFPAPGPWVFINGKPIPKDQVASFLSQNLASGDQNRRCIGATATGIFGLSFWGNALGTRALISAQFDH